MTPQTGNLLLSAILPILTVTIPRTVPPIGCEDHEELIADATLSAAQMVQSLEDAGKEINPNSVAFYAIQRAKVGRKSTSGKRCCPLSTGAILDGKSAPLSLETDGSRNQDIDDSSFTIGDIIADDGDDPATSVARVLDWEAFQKSLPKKQRTLLSSLMNEERPKDIATKLGISPARVTQLKREIGVKLKKFMGKNVLADAIRPSIWQRDLQVRREQIAARAG